MANPAYVQSSSATTGAPGSLAFNSNNAVGNLLVVWVSTNGSAITCQDTNNGNVYSIAIPSQATGTATVACFYLPNCKAGANTIQLSATGAAFLRFAIAEYSNVALSVPLDGVVLNIAQSAPTPSSGNIVTLGMNDLLIGLSDSGGTTLLAGIGYTLRENPSNAVSLEDSNSANNSPGNQSATFVTTGNADVGIVAFKALSSTPPVSSGGWLNTQNDYTNKRGVEW